MAKKSKQESESSRMDVEKPESSVKLRGPVLSTAEPNRCPAVSPSPLREQCEQMDGHEGWHSTTGSAWKNFSVPCAAPRRQEMLTNVDLRPAAEPSIAEAPAGVVVLPEGLRVPRGCPTIRVEDIPEIRVTDGPCEMGWTEPSGVRVAVCGPTSASVQAVVDMLQTRQDAKEVVGAVQQLEPLLARIAELEERLARQAASHREVRKRLLRKARGGR